MEIEVKPSSLERVPELASVLARALGGDPMLVWPLPPDDVEERIRLNFLWLSEGYAALGMLWDAADGAGAAAWVPAGEADRVVSVDAAVRPRIASITDDGGARYDAFWDWIQGHMPEEPHWFLDYVGVEPDRQGEGIGSALVELGLSRARRDGVPAFLETGQPANVGYYERFGFAVIEEADAPGGGPHIWFMQFQP